MIKRDLHVHLHGCLSAEQLWNIGKDTYKSRIPMLEWYANEYEKAWGYRPDYIKYWESDSGFDNLRDDYLFSSQGTFDKFQANFNLIIALCNISTDDFFIQGQIIDHVSRSGLEYFEARTLIPFRFNENETFTYLKGLCQTVRDANKQEPLLTKLVFSLFRENSLAKKHYDWIRHFMDIHPDLAEEIVGIDFAYKEEGCPPKDKDLLINQFHIDNKSKKPLKILYHVGESFEDKSIISAIRWIVEAHELGVDRIGHAIALGVDPNNYKNKKVYESVEERIDTINWLLKNKDFLSSFGYKFSPFSLKKELENLRSSSTPIEIEYTSEYINEVDTFQNACIEILKNKSRDVLIETCPTSNFRIGNVKNEKYHPLIKFHRKNLNYVVATDDPGIFDIDWKSEEKYANHLVQKYC